MPHSRLILCLPISMLTRGDMIGSLCGLVTVQNRFRLKQVILWYGSMSWVDPLTLSVNYLNLLNLINVLIINYNYQTKICTVII